MTLPVAQEAAPGISRATIEMAGRAFAAHSSEVALPTEGPLRATQGSISNSGGGKSQERSLLATGPTLFQGGSISHPASDAAEYSARP